MRDVVCGANPTLHVAVGMPRALVACLPIGFSSHPRVTVSTIELASGQALADPRVSGERSGAMRARELMHEYLTP